MRTVPASAYTEPQKNPGPTIAVALLTALVNFVWWFLAALSADLNCGAQEASVCSAPRSAHIAATPYLFAAVLVLTLASVYFLNRPNVRVPLLTVAGLAQAAGMWLTLTMPPA